MDTFSLQPLKVVHFLDHYGRKTLNIEPEKYYIWLELVRIFFLTWIISRKQNKIVFNEILGTKLKVEKFQLKTFDWKLNI